MLTSHELFGFMSSGLALQILEHAHQTNKELYKAALCSVAEARKLRPMFFERVPRAQRHADMVSMLGRPRLELTAASLIRDWLMKKQNAMLCEYLNSLGIAHKEGAVEELPAQVPDDKLNAAVDNLLAKFPAEEVIVYLNAFYSMNDVRWANLETLLQDNPRLQFAN
jgi:hypothetical protein